MLLNFRWDRIVQINFGLSGFAQSETTRITAQRIAQRYFRTERFAQSELENWGHFFGLAIAQTEVFSQRNAQRKDNLICDLAHCPW